MLQELKKTKSSYFFYGIFTDQIEKKTKFILSCTIKLLNYLKNILRKKIIVFLIF